MFGIVSTRFIFYFNFKLSLNNKQTISTFVWIYFWNAIENICYGIGKILISYHQVPFHDWDIKVHRNNVTVRKTTNFDNEFFCDCGVIIILKCETMITPTWNTNVFAENWLLPTLKFIHSLVVSIYQLMNKIKVFKIVHLFGVLMSTC